MYQYHQFDQFWPYDPSSVWECDQSTVLDIRNTTEKDEKKVCQLQSHQSVDASSPAALMYSIRTLPTWSKARREPICRLLDTQTQMINCTSDTHVASLSRGIGALHHVTDDCCGWSDSPTVILKATVHSPFPMMSISQLSSLTTADAAAAWLFSAPWSRYGIHTACGKDRAKYLYTH